MIISLHIPKSAGTSFRHALEHVYGTGLWLNYGDDFSLDAVPPGTECIHGHIPGNAYNEIFPDQQTITMVRHPVERVVSNYYHFLRHPDHRHPASRALHERGLSLAAFARLDTMRNKTTRYVAGRSPEDFAFVGITERFEESMLLYGQVFNLPEPLPVFHDNVNMARDTADYPLTSSEYEELAALNIADLNWYERACDLFESAIADVPMRKVG